MSSKPSNFIQWKGTDLCMDFYCKCGAQSHFDGYFAYTIKCPNCGTVYKLIPSVKMEEVSPKDPEFSNEHLEPIDIDE